MRMSTLFACLLVLGAGGVLIYLWMPRGPSAEELAEIEELASDAQRYSRQRRYADVISVAEDLLEKDNADPEIMLLAGDAAAQLKDYKTAMNFFDRIPRDDSEPSLKAAYSKCAIEFYYGTFARAEKQLDALLKRAPTHLEGNQLMSELMDLTGRRWETVPYSLEVLRQGKPGQDTLLRLADQEQVVDRLKRMRGANARDQNDPGPLLGLSRAAEFDGQPDAARALIERVLDLRPDLVEAHVRLGFHVIDRAPEEFVEWHSRLPREAEAHPDIWVIRGRWARENGQLKAAARCFWEAISRNPNEARGMRQLALTLPRVGLKGRAEQFLERSRTLFTLRKAIQDIYRATGRVSSNNIQDIAELMDKLGRKPEARAWRELVGGRFEPPPKMPRPRSAADVVAVWVAPQINPAQTINLASWPMPDLTQVLQSEGISYPRQFVARYENQAEQTGLNFTQVSAPDESTEGRRIIETLGGGVAAFDIDLDSWPDFLFTQIGVYPSAEEKSYDKLFRQVDGRFVDVTTLAGIDGPEFGQGVAVGDVNSDGFPDLFVANMGRNKLYTNNGDGTLTDTTTMLNDTYKDWSTSAALADVNGDALPDLYVTNYLSGEGVDSAICDTDGTPTTCGPDAFEAAQDRFFLNMGDGTFEDQTRASGLVTENGKGLGVLAADFNADGSLLFFVANDGVDNFLFSKHPTEDRFENLSTFSGTATSDDGVAQGSMGIAAADADQDGRLDLFVTNFDSEFNAMYVSLGPGEFRDKVKQAKLADGSYRMVGFGTQFIDGELDGLPDLLIANGNVDDYSRLKKDDEQTEDTQGKRRVAGVTYKMPTQYFRNVGGLTYRELFSEDVGEYFDGLQLGRSMSRTDWNRDGRHDVVISSIGSPASLVTNVSDKTGHFLSLRLVGTTANRDAVGSIVHVRDGDWVRMQQITGGDGYMSANERKLIFGLGERSTVPKLEIRWLDGSKSEFENIEADQEILIRQGERDLLVVPR